MPTSFLIAWRQLSFHKAKLAAAVAGVVAAVMLMLVQLGIRQGAIDNSVAICVRGALVWSRMNRLMKGQMSDAPTRLTKNKTNKTRKARGNLGSLCSMDEP